MSPVSFNFVNFVIADHSIDYMSAELGPPVAVGIWTWQTFEFIEYRALYSQSTAFVAPRMLFVPTHHPLWSNTTNSTRCPFSASPGSEPTHDRGVLFYTLRFLFEFKFTFTFKNRIRTPHCSGSEPNRKSGGIIGSGSTHEVGLPLHRLNLSCSSSFLQWRGRNVLSATVFVVLH